MTKVAKVAFNGGVISDEAAARVDIERYQSALALCENGIVLVPGGVTKAPGTRFVAETKYGDKKSRLESFTFAEDETYILEFGDLYVRFYRNGGPVLADPSTILEVPTPYLEADLFRLDIIQSADVLTITHPNYAVKDLKRLSSSSWVLENRSFSPAVTPPGPLTLIHGGVNSADKQFWSWVVTSVDPKTGEESLPSPPLEVNIDLAGTGFQNKAEFTWAAVPGITEYNVYRGANGLHGYVGTSVNKTSFRDDNILPNYSLTPPIDKQPFNALDNYPATNCFFAQRQLFAGLRSKPQTLFGTEIGNYRSLRSSRIPKDDDGFEVTIGSTQIDEIRWIRPLGPLLLGTAGAIHRAAAANGTPVAADTLDPKVQVYHGSAYVFPVVIGNTLLFVQQEGATVRAVEFSQEAEAFQGADLSIMASHLFRGHSIVQLAYAQHPLSVVWACRDDGTLLAMTYQREQQVWAWTTRVTDGAVESVACVTEQGESASYVVVRRTIGGVQKRYVEKMVRVDHTDRDDSFALDSALSFDGRNKDAGAWVRVVGASYLGGDQVTITSNRPIFNSGMVLSDKQSYLFLTDPTEQAAGDERASRIKVKLIGTSSPTDATGVLVSDLPTALQNAQTTSWSIAPVLFSGVDHLEGKAVGIVADSVVSEPVNIVGGSFQLPEPAAVVHCGIRFALTVRTLPLNVVGTSLVFDRKLVNAVYVKLKNTATIKAGERLDELETNPARFDEKYDAPPDYKADLLKIPITASWNRHGQIYLVHDDPVPATILTVVPDVMANSRG